MHLINRNRLKPGRLPTSTSATSVATGSSVETGSHSPPDDNWETLGLSSTEYARTRKEMMQLINDLRSLGQVENRSVFCVAELFSPVRRH